MANIKSAKKRARQSIVRTEKNRYYRTRMKNMARAIEEAVKAGDKDKAADALKVANKSFHAYASKGIIKQNKAARSVSRFNKLVKSLHA
ncbi:MAG: 30S ribosomal protein S20 [Campylobacterales bacterium]